MDTFLKNLYRENMEKQATVDQQCLYRNLSAEELETLLGLNKIAVAGSPDAGADDFRCPNCGVASGEHSSSCPCCQAAAEAAVADKAFPKKTGDAEMPTGKTASVKLAEPPAAPSFFSNLEGGWHGAGSHLHDAHLSGQPLNMSFLKRPGTAVKLLGQKGVSLGGRLGGAARLVAPHAALLAGGVYAGSKLLGGDKGKEVRASADLRGRLRKIAALDLPPMLKPGESLTSYTGQPAASVPTAPSAGAKPPAGSAISPMTAEEAAAAAKTRGPAAAAAAKPAAAAAERGFFTNLQRGWGRTGTALERVGAKGGEMGRLGFWRRPGAALSMLGKGNMSMGARLGGAARLMAPHVGILGAGLLGAKLLFGGGQQQPQKVVYAEAGFLKMAAASVDGAPLTIRSEAAKLAAARFESEGFRNLSKTEKQIKVAKTAAVLSLEHRESLPTKSFAIPEKKAKQMGTAHKIEGESKGRYPIHDRIHARAALSYVSRHGSEAEKSMVRAKVHSKYPDIGKEATYDHENY